ncbi:glycosyltransferase [Novosphingobium jiangmenense]|uniref:Glycosyltransferase n=1 Tax=Novosphingobium jiangmenense TaxID=2791981 RepID=A0ABS0HBZ8_9SPHN|nr:glycosyltransferase [Novosphingobium jiangmenense]MBF9149653.1 glycosyltransferase [Novosphingobium jiangmenense]
MTSTLYLTRNGLLEPLGQSQVLAYLRGLSRDYRITLITYEKDEDWADRQRVLRQHEECNRLGICWLPQRFRPRPKVIAPALSMLRMVWLVRREVRAQGARLIHARSYIPAAVAMIVSRLTGVPFIFDMRALWPEELITARRLRRGSLLHRAIAATERACLQRARAVVSLTHAAVDHLARVYPEHVVWQKITVIPTCADLDRFVSAGEAPPRRVIGCLGTVLSGWFRLDWLASFLSAAATCDEDAVFELTTRDDPAPVRAALDPDGQLGDRLQIAPSAPEDVQKVLQGQTASVMFYAGGEISELGRSPTRMAEILGCGLPVVANEGVGDVARIIRAHRVGVLAAGAEPEAMAAAWSELTALLQDPGLSARCRKAAEEVFSLDSGTAAYARVYEQVLEDKRACAA